MLRHPTAAVTADQSTLPPSTCPHPTPTPANPIDPSDIIRVTGCHTPGSFSRAIPTPGPEGSTRKDQLPALIPDAAARE